MAEPWDISENSNTYNNTKHATHLLSSIKGVTHKLTKLTDIVSHIGGGTLIAVGVYMTVLRREVCEYRDRERHI